MVSRLRFSASSISPKGEGAPNARSNIRSSTTVSLRGNEVGHQHFHLSINACRASQATKAVSEALVFYGNQLTPGSAKTYLIQDSH